MKIFKKCAKKIRNFYLCITQNLLIPIFCPQNDQNLWKFQ